MSFSELLIVLLVALLVVGPQQLPSLARKVGRWLGKAKDLTANIQSEFEEQLKLDQLEENTKRAVEAVTNSYDRTSSK